MFLSGNRPFFLLFTGFASLISSSAHAQPPAIDVPALPATGMLRLIEAYPDHLKGYSVNLIVWKDGTAMPYDDGRIKTEDETFDSSDLEDQMNGLVYIPGPMVDTPGYNCDPGTFRNQDFFRKMYGSTAEEVQSRLVSVRWPAKTPGRTQRVLITSVNGVNRHLQAVANELAARPRLRKYVTDIGGTYNWRNIQGTSRQSPHSFGIAIDINTRHSEYWKWDYPTTWQIDSVEQRLRWRNSVPWEVVEIFERHGFIWGGKWYHYDTMHFEFRPELLPPAALAPVKPASRKTAVNKPAGTGGGNRSRQ
jgi:peptidoglycan L-alanyl-D-glutamate endopeptidase CwlK